MLTIPANGTIAGVAASGANEVTCTLHLMELNAGTGVETYTYDQQQLAATAATIYTATANGPTFVRSIHVVNTDTVDASTFQLFAGGTAAANAITPEFTIPAGGMAAYGERGWNFYDDLGQLLTGPGFRRLNVQAFVTPGTPTYTPTAGMQYCLAILTGAGGGGGGSDTSAGSGDVGAGGGGQAGATCIGFFTAAQVGASVALAVGATGAAGSNSGGIGGAGGTSTWNTTTMIATGGNGGTGSTTSAVDVSATAGGAGAAASSGGAINIAGGAGEPGIGGSADGTIDLLFAKGGNGGSSFWGGGGSGAVTASNTLTNAVNTAGTNAAAYGSGGGGAVSTASATGAVGGTGAGGCCLVIEFC